MRSDALMKNLVKCITNKHDDIYSIFLEDGFKGGWELWLQVEWFLYLKTTGTINQDLYGFAKEISYPQGNAQCDFVLIPHRRGSQIWVELKTMSQQGNFKGSIEGFVNDIDKLNEAKLNGATKVAVLVLVGAEAIKSFIEIIGNNFQKVFYEKLRFAYQPAPLKGSQVEIKEFVNLFSDIKKKNLKQLYEGESEIGPIFIAYMSI